MEIWQKELHEILVQIVLNITKYESTFKIYELAEIDQNIVND